MTALRIIYNSKPTSFQDLLDKVNPVTAHQRNVKNLATAIPSTYF